MRGNDAVVFGGTGLGSGMKDQDRSGATENGILPAFPNLNRLHVTRIPALCPLKIRRNGFSGLRQLFHLLFHPDNELPVVAHGQVDEFLNLVLIPDHQDLYILRIAPCGRLAGGLEQTGKDFVGNFLGKKVPMGSAGFQEFDEGIRIGLPAPVIDLSKLIRTQFLMGNGILRTYSDAMTAEIAIRLIGETLHAPLFFGKTPETDRGTDSAGIALRFINRYPIHHSTFSPIS
jgi:hypothetical protein